jgi:aquaporin Z
MWPLRARGYVTVETFGRRQTSNRPIMDLLRRHWPEYASEAICLALFMVSAVACATLLQHPESPLALWDASPLVRRIPMGLAMGVTAVALIYSPMGVRSGAHMNPGVTLTFLRLGKIAPGDAAGYIAAQFVGGAAGIVMGVFLFWGLPAHPAVGFVATTPGAAGSAVAFGAELLISFLLMTTVLALSNAPRLARFTGLGAGALVAAFIVFEAPFSGMSMNPARTLGSNVLASMTSSLWIYFVAPPLGMLLAGERYVRRHGVRAVRCAKLHHPRSGRCIFRCGHLETDAWTRPAATT